MVSLFTIAIVPVCIFCLYIYIKDKYEKEPKTVLLICLIYGLFISAPIYQTSFLLNKGFALSNGLYYSIVDSFVFSGLVEESFKFIFLFLLVWKDINFNEWFDGIVYSVFLSLGFAFIENILYVFNPSLGGLETGIYRGLFSVPIHGLLGVSMGYYLGIAKFDKINLKKNLIYSFLFSWILHGTYNFILSFNNILFIVIFIPFIIGMWFISFKQIKSHIEKSPFKPK